ncbi:hypothetical protein C6569_14455 [Phreatobacter cathodiphilus]|uniref:Uncharacterized protein n=2 Tax=Phreatobacter cathodiphilus TaxID=1868589 RepID=A0A2S0NDD3_9HYPH|nr:hypothetical protein C6569_14455 [Phreatobacter cathodiphilus]
MEVLKQKNLARLKRVDTASVLARTAPVVAGLCDRFTIAADADHASELARFGGRFPQSGDWYAKGLCYGPPHGSVTREALRQIIAAEDLSGWVEFCARTANTDAVIIIGVDTAALPDLIPELLDMDQLPEARHAETPQLDDCWIINRAARWGLLLWHEGRIVLERL